MEQQVGSLRQRLSVIIFGTNTPAGRLFDLILIYSILISVAAVVLDSVEELHLDYGIWFFYLEWLFTLVFTVEYFLRIYISEKPLKYIFSFFGLIDLVSIIPSYLALFITGAHYLLIIRLLRVLRIFRVLKLVRYMSEANLLMRSLYLARRKIFVFFFTVIVLSFVFGSLMFLIEGPRHGFTSIPKSIYWTIVTITTVGYGDITPQTILGQFISVLAMLTGYSIIAIPTGIITAEMAGELGRVRSARLCGNCGRAGHETDARYCKYCGGGELPEHE
ncbi:MAG TPA: ion transporter [Porticoccaceae bacterium]|nr:ion transporter [Porticoccaceae bacterium]HCO61892.1 ion transporter [Porticoccaceae bacterium]